MKINRIVPTVITLVALLGASVGRADTITATGGGDWYSTANNAPWPGGIVPAATDDAIITGAVGAGTTVTIHNLTINGSSTFFNGNSVNVTGDLTLDATAKVQQGAAITIGGNLVIGSGTTYDPSCFDMSVTGNTTVSGTLKDGCGGGGLTDSLGSVSILPGGLWMLTDVSQWSVNGSITNEGSTTGTSGRVTLVGTGRLTGSSGVTMPNMTINGTYEIATTVTVSNSPIFNGTLVMNIDNAASQNMLVIPTHAINYGGTLTVNNVGGPLVEGNTFQLFSATGYSNSFAVVNLPTLGSGSWVDNLASSGSIAVSGGGGGSGSPPIQWSVGGGELTLSWDTTTYPGYLVQGQTNTTGIGAGWTDATSVDASPYVVAIDGLNPGVFFRLFKP